MKKNQKTALCSALIFAVVVLLAGAIVYYLFFFAKKPTAADQPTYFTHFETAGDIAKIILQRSRSRIMIAMAENATLARNYNATLEIGDASESATTTFTFHTTADRELVTVADAKRNMVVVDVQNRLINETHKKGEIKSINQKNVIDVIRLDPDNNKSATVDIKAASITIKSTFVTVIIENLQEYPPLIIDAKGPKNQLVRVGTIANSTVFCRRDSEDMIIVVGEGKQRFETKIEPKLWKIEGKTNDSNDSFLFVTSTDDSVTVGMKTLGFSLDAVPFGRQKQGAITDADRVTMAVLNAPDVDAFDRLTVHNGTSRLEVDAANRTAHLQTAAGSLDLSASRQVTFNMGAKVVASVNLNDGNVTMDNQIIFNLADDEMLATSASGCFVLKKGDRVEKVLTSAGVLAQEIEEGLFLGLDTIDVTLDKHQLVRASVGANRLSFEDGEARLLSRIAATKVARKMQTPADFDAAMADDLSFDVLANNNSYAALKIGADGKLRATLGRFAAEVRRGDATLRGPWGDVNFKDFEFPKQ